MEITFEIPNHIYLPNSEAYPDLGVITLKYDPLSEADAGTEGIHHSFCDTNSEEVSTNFRVDGLVQIFEEAVEEANDTDVFTTELLSNTDAKLYRWLKQAEGYCRDGLTEADESNPMLEAFIYN